MPSLKDLVRAATELGAEDREWLHVLVADWQLLADLSFSDLVLWVPTRDREYVAVAQMRPDDRADGLPRRHRRHDRRTRLAAAAGRGAGPGPDRPRGRSRNGGTTCPSASRRSRSAAGTRCSGVIARNTSLISARTPSRLELTYLQCAGDLARMIAAGLFPHVGAVGSIAERIGDGSPRVGDGLIRLDADGNVTYASPNALSAYRRLGLATDLVGTHLGRLTAELAPTRGPVEEALAVVAGGPGAPRARGRDRPRRRATCARSRWTSPAGTSARSSCCGT